MRLRHRVLMWLYGRKWVRDYLDRRESRAWHRAHGPIVKTEPNYGAAPAKSKPKRRKA